MRINNFAYRLALMWLGLVAMTAILSPFVFAEKAGSMDFTQILMPPSFAHPFGTDALGRDLLARVMLGSSVSLGVSVGAVLGAIALGVWYGALSGYFGGRLDRVMMGFLNVMLCFPVLFLILAVIAILGPSAWNILWIIALTGWMGTARLMRAEVLTLKEREYILAARLAGAGSLWIIRKHLIPNAMAPILVNAVLSIASAVLIEAGLSFLGIGVQPPTPSWGNILTDAKAVMGAGWHPVFFPGLMIFLTVLSVNMVGERLQKR